MEEPVARITATSARIRYLFSESTYACTCMIPAKNTVSKII
jgi:hypothetical protein